MIYYNIKSKHLIQYSRQNNFSKAGMFHLSKARKTLKSNSLYPKAYIFKLNCFHK